MSDPSLMYMCQNCERDVAYDFKTNGLYLCNQCVNFETLVFRVNELSKRVEELEKANSNPVEVKQPVDLLPPPIESAVSECPASGTDNWSWSRSAPRVYKCDTCGLVVSTLKKGSRLPIHARPGDILHHFAEKFDVILCPGSGTDLWDKVHSGNIGKGLLNPKIQCQICQWVFFRPDAQGKLPKHKEHNDD